MEAWASHKSFRRKDDAGDRPGASGEVDFHGEKRGNETHQSTTDPEARLYKKSKGSEAKLSYLGHVLIENRHGLLVQTMLTQAVGRAERDAGLLLAEKIPGVKHVTLGGDKNYDTEEFVRELRRMHITPHVAQNHTNRTSAIDRRTTRHIGYELSQQKRKRVEQSFAWMKVIGMLKKVKLRGLEKVGWLFTFTGAAYNLCRLRNLQVQAVGGCVGPERRGSRRRGGSHKPCLVPKRPFAFFYTDQKTQKDAEKRFRVKIFNKLLNRHLDKKKTIFS